MERRRPEFSKSKLKNMFLKVLLELRPGGKLDYRSNNTSSIVSAWMNEYFNIQLTEDERQKLFEGIDELRSANPICQDYEQGPSFVKLTAKGKTLAIEEKDPDVHGVQLQEIIKNGKIISTCQDDFDSGKYEKAIFSAYKLVEEEVRVKAGLSESDYGVSLITKALHPDKGVLSIPQCKLVNEQEAVYNLFKGALGFFKNPSSHRTVNYNEPLITIEILAFAELLLKILSTAQVKP
jgi:uncharacterized protein (TIGR02391 family)